MNIDTDPKKIEDVLNRSIDTIYPSKEALKELLSSGKQLRIYSGIDPTADFVHMGHAINYLILERFHKLGHKIIVLVGDFTAMIGDPTDKSATRKRLTRDEVNNNLASFKEQIGKILNFDDSENPIEFAFNSSWLNNLSFSEIADIASNFTVQQMLERDFFEKRMGENKPLYVHEFFYPLMQGYDSVALGADIEVGGTDQTFNMLAGRTLVKKYQEREKFVITHPLLEDPETGKILMSKSEGTGIALNDLAENMFGKVMALPDMAIIPMYVHCTRLSLNEIEKIESRIKEGENPKNLKMELAKDIVSMYYSKEDAEKAEESWKKAFEKGGVPDDISSVKVSAGVLLSDILLNNSLVESKTEYKRLISSESIKIFDSKGEKEVGIVNDPMYQINEDVLIKVGKKRFIKIEIE